MLHNVGPIIVLGAPSVVRLLEQERVEVTLVDRQPLQGVKSHIVSPIEDFVPTAKFRTAIADPPWYPQQLQLWSNIAARAVGVGGTVFLSVWPNNTRPGAGLELTNAFSSMLSWGKIRRGIDELKYLEPQFEVVAQDYGGKTQLSRSPLVGELVRLDVLRVPKHLVGTRTEERWLRFTVNNYQLALRLDVVTASSIIDFVHGIEDWRWPYVSARAPFRQQIGLWSSSGEVASVGDPSALALALRAAFDSPDELGFEKALAAVPQLLSWTIPRPPYQRAIEWQHKQ